MSPVKGSETRNSGQYPAARDFKVSLTPKAPAPADSWWLCDPETFKVRAAEQQARMNFTSTSYTKPKHDDEAQPWKGLDQ